MNLLKNQSKKIKELFNDISLKNNDENFNPSEKLKEDIENIIDKRLEELTPEHKNYNERNDSKTFRMVGCMGRSIRFFNWFITWNIRKP